MRGLLAVGFEAQLDFAEQNSVALATVRDDAAFAVDDDAIDGMEIKEFEIVTVDFQHGVVLGDARVIEMNAVLGIAAAGEIFAAQLEHGAT